MIVRTTHWVTAVGVAIAAGTTGLVAFRVSLAGTIDPPSGPVTPTSVTLQQIYDRIDQIGAGVGMCCGPCLIAQTPQTGQTQEQFLPGNGLVHSVIIPALHDLRVWSRPNGSLTAIAQFQNGSNADVQYFLNVRYEGGLWISQLPFGSTDGCSILYRPD